MTTANFLTYISETDARNEQDTLASYRVLTASLQRLMSFEDRAFIAVGLKGIGKTASFLTLSSDSAVEFIHSISAETQELDIDVHKKPTAQYLPDLRAELIIQALVTIQDVIRAKPDIASKIPQDVRANIQVEVAKFWKKLKGVAEQIGGVSILGVGFSLRSKTGKTAPVSLISRTAYRPLLELLRQALADLKFRLVIDDPEAIFSSGPEINETLITALCLVAHELQVRIPNFKCVILVKPNVLERLRLVDEFPNLPIASQVRLAWSDDELKNVIRLRAKAASVDLTKLFKADPEPALNVIVRDSRSGPRDALRRLDIQFMRHPDMPVTPASLELTVGTYSGVCYEQMSAPYQGAYPGLARVSLALFEGASVEIERRQLSDRLIELVATSSDLPGIASEPWMRDAGQLYDLLVRFGLVAIVAQGSLMLPFHGNYMDAASDPGARLTYLPGLRGRMPRAETPPVAQPRSSAPKRQSPKR